MASTINATPTASGLISSADASGVLALQTGGTTAVTIDGSQNVTLNNVIPSGSTAPTNGMFLPAANTVGLSTASTERMRIDSSGNVLVGTTSSVGGGGNGGTVQAVSNVAPFKARNTNASAAKYWAFGPDSSSSNYIVFNENSIGAYIAYGGTSWTANSDERLKTEITPFKNAVEKIISLRAGTGRYLTDDKSVSRSFLIAQDVQKVLPEAVNVQDNEQKTLGVSYTDVIPLLVASIKELNTKLEAQALEIQALKGVA